MLFLGLGCATIRVVVKILGGIVDGIRGVKGDEIFKRDSMEGTLSVLLGDSEVGSGAQGILANYSSAAIVSIIG